MRPSACALAGQQNLFGSRVVLPFAISCSRRFTITLNHKPTGCSQSDCHIVQRTDTAVPCHTQLAAQPIDRL